MGEGRGEAVGWEGMESGGLGKEWGVGEEMRSGEGSVKGGEVEYRGSIGRMEGRKRLDTTIQSSR